VKTTSRFPPRTLGLPDGAIRPAEVRSEAGRYRETKGRQRAKPRPDESRETQPSYAFASSASGSSFAMACALTFMEQNLGPHMLQKAAVL
jgi:hypothetical protein